MRPNHTRITLIAPGCFSALALSGEPETQPQPAEPVPELNESAVIVTATRSYEQSVALALRQSVPELGALPIAQHRFLFDTDKKAAPHCVCAELVHLQADKDNARLLPIQALNITDDESAQLIEELNHLLYDDGISVLRTAKHHYYLTGMPASELDTWPAHSVANGKIADYLPRKAQAGDWRRLMTEVQMLFHSHPVNLARENARQLPINAMWFWGGMQATMYAPVSNIELVTTDAYACGLASALSLTPRQPEDFNWSNVSGEVVIVELGVYEAWLSGDQDALHHAKQKLQQQWIAPAQEAVANGSCSEFVLDGCEGQTIVEKPKPALNRFSLRQWITQRMSKSTSTGDGEKKSDTSL